jgi:UDP-N-acetylglucosamine 2-epimerase (non-hydrolysing)
MKPVKLICVVGARPNFMKAAPLIRVLRNSPAAEVLVHTGQHYDDTMSGQFMRRGTGGVSPVFGKDTGP